MDDELAELRARVAELEQRVAVLFEQTGAAQASAARAEARSSVTTTSLTPPKVV